MDGLFQIMLILGMLFIVVGFLLQKFPPKKINWFYGYRTSTSMQNQQVWNYAQQLGGKLLVYYGLLLVVLSPIGICITLDYTTKKYVELGTVFVVLAIFFMQSENRLKKFLNS